MATKRKLASIAALVVSATIVLSGCNRSDTAIHIGADGDIGAAVTQVGVQKAALEPLGITNLEQFRFYIEQERNTPGASENCTYSENNKEYVLTCDSNDVSDEFSPFSEISVTRDGNTLVMSARKGALTGDLVDYRLGGEASGTIVFYFDGGTITQVQGAQNHRQPSDNVITFDMVDGEFFPEDTVVVVDHSANVTTWFLVGGILVAIVLGAVALSLSRRKPKNPFVESEEELGRSSDA